VQVTKSRDSHPGKRSFLTADHLRMNPPTSKIDPVSAKQIKWGDRQVVVFHRLAQVLEVRPTGKSTLYADIGRGVFPKPVRLGPKLSVWQAHEVFAVNAAVAAGKTEDEIRALVKRLETARAALVA
jgi:prophage regulatory protein